MRSAEASEQFIAASVSRLSSTVKWCNAAIKRMWAGADQTIAKYLARDAEPEACAPFDITGRHHSVLVIPASDESPDFIQGVLPALEGSPGALLIVVVNANPTSGAQVQARNQQLIQALCGLGVAASELVPGLIDVKLACGGLLLVDRSSQGRELPLKQGVGLARKIGCDIAINLWKQGAVASPWLFSSDADVTLPPAYFAAGDAARPDAGALVFDFTHQASGEPELDRATFEYELYLRYYTLGLAWAGSPYAFNTLGSCLAIRAEAYAAVRGFPKREAGEDFHLLSKLAKVAAVQTVHQPQITIAARRSLRTPFGTGARVETLLAGAALGFHDPQLFALLRSLLAALRVWATNPTPSLVPPDQQGPLWRHCVTVLEELGLNEALGHAAGMAREPAARLLHLHTWFDALKTLRTLRAVQQRSGLSELNWRAAVGRAPFIALPAGLDLVATLQRVRQLGREGPTLRGLVSLTTLPG